MESNLEKIRESLNLSKKDFCEKIDITYQSYQNYLNGRQISTEVLIKLKRLFNININWMLTDNGTMFDEPNNQEIKTSNFSELINEELKNLSDKQKEYYYHRIKSDVLENELKYKNV